MLTLLKKSTSFTLILALLVSSFAIAIPTPAYAATIFSDDFNTGNFSAWTTADDEWEIITDNHSAPKAAEIEDTDSGDDELRKNVSTAGYTAVTLSYWYKIPGGLSSSEDLLVQWYDGTSWNTIVNYDSTGTVATWTLAAPVVLPAGANNNANFRLRFLGEGLNNDQFRLDDVSLTGTALPPPNTPPVAISGVALTNEDTPVGITLGAIDADLNPLTYTIVANPANGVLSGSGSSRTYTPNLNFNGLDSFTFKVNDGTVDSNTATVIITVFGVNDAPTGNDDAYSTDEDTQLDVPAPGVLVNDADTESDPLTATLVSPATNGTVTLNPDGSFSYMPNLDFVGTDTFTYTNNDGALSCVSPITVTITVSNDNDVPVANDDSYLASEDTQLVEALPGVLGNDADADSDPLTAILEDNVTNGVLVLNSDGSFTYDPAPGFVGSDSFTYKANDGTVSSGEATVTITVQGVNDAPVAVDGTNATTMDVPVSGTLSASDPEGDTLTFVNTSPVNGALTAFDSATGAYTYTPALGFTGTDTFTFSVTDGSATSNTATVTITVTPPVIPPAVCADGIDNDGDNATDYPADPGCVDAQDTDETDPVVQPPANPAPTGGGGGGGGGGIIGGPMGFANPVTSPTPSVGGGQVLGTATGPTDCPAYLLEYIQLGKENNPDEVKKLQTFLNESEGTQLEVSGIYDTLTYEAVRSFQQKYFGDVMGPWAAAQVTGFVYHTTKKKVNELHCAMTKEFPLTAEQEAEIARVRALNLSAPVVPGTTPTPTTDEVGAEEGETSSQTAAVADSPAGQSIWDGIVNFFGKIW